MSLIFYVHQSSYLPLSLLVAECWASKLSVCCCSLKTDLDVDLQLWVSEEGKSGGCGCNVGYQKHFATSHFPPRPMRPSQASRSSQPSGASSTYVSTVALNLILLKYRENLQAKPAACLSLINSSITASSPSICLISTSCSCFPSAPPLLLLLLLLSNCCRDSRICFARRRASRSRNTARLQVDCPLPRNTVDLVQISCSISAICWLYTWNTDMIISTWIFLLLLLLVLWFQVVDSPLKLRKWRL